MSGETFAAIERAKENLRDALADVMLDALKREAGIILTEREHDKLREKLTDALRGSISL